MIVGPTIGGPTSSTMSVMVEVAIGVAWVDWRAAVVWEAAVVLTVV
jgi:hypothetical protein